MVSTRGSGRTSALADLFGNAAGTEDGRLFAHDVVEEYPDMKDAYVKVCPNRIDLGAMKRKAEEGLYVSADIAIADVSLMVSNCVKFNGEETLFGQAARRVAAHLKPEILKLFAATESASVAGPATWAARGTLRLSAGSSTTASAGTKRQRDDSANQLEGIVSVVSQKQLLDLVAQCDRPEDEAWFTRDVVEMFPMVAVDYDTICPVRMDLDRIRSKIKLGVYGMAEPASSLPGTNASRVLTEVLQDLRMIADNCIRYNGAESLPGLRAANFFQHCKKVVKSFASRSGISLAADPVALVSSDATSVSAAEKILLGVGPAPVVEPPIPSIVVREFVVPRVKLLPYQIPFHIPPTVRHRILSAHINKDAQTCTFLPRDCDSTVANVVAAFIVTLVKQCEELADSARALLVEASDASSPEGGGSSGGDDCHVKKEEGPVETSSAADAVATLTPLTRATSALVRVRAQQQQITQAKEILRVLQDVYESVFPGVLLYTQERCDVDAYAATHHCCSAAAGGSFHWAEVTHIDYFLRLVVLFPEVGTLVSAHTAAPVPSTAARAQSHKLPAVSRVTAVDAATSQLMSQEVVPLLEDFLCFVEAHAARLF